jgi:hypothetical protein
MQHCSSQVKVKNKGKVGPLFLTEHHAMKLYWEIGGIAPCGYKCKNLRSRFCVCVCVCVCESE